MSMEKPEDFGTNIDRSINKDYCHFCFKNGTFTEQDITVEQMIDKVAEFAVTQMKISETQAKEMAKTLIPTLKRWQTEK